MSDRLAALTMPEPNSGCWLFLGALIRRGYGLFSVDGRNRMAHQTAFLLTGGLIPEGFEIDHLCRNHACVNPEHLEPVPHRVNVLRGTSVVARNAKKTACQYGHPFDQTNTRLVRDPGGTVRRVCRVCTRDRRAAYKARRKIHEAAPLGAAVGGG